MALEVEVEVVVVHEEEVAEVVAVVLEVARRIVNFVTATAIG